MVEPTRRGFLAAGLTAMAGLVAGCSSGSGTPSSTTSSGTATPRPASSAGSATSTPTAGSGPATSAASGSATTSAGPASSGRGGLPGTTPWQPNPGDLQPTAKVAAVRRVEGTASPTHAVQVDDAQYGGLLDAAASVLVVCREWQLAPDGTVRAGGSTYDVRVSRAGSAWQVTAVNPSTSGPPSASPSAAATRVLSTPRIVLPPASAADVASGQVHDSVLNALLALSSTYEIGVSVVRSGHPLDVFGTSRPSDHPLGRAVDTYRINGRLVVDPGTPKALVTGYMADMAAAGSYNVGGPYLLGAAPQWFSDATHHDHVHAGFRT